MSTATRRIAVTALAAVLVVGTGLSASATAFRPLAGAGSATSVAASPIPLSQTQQYVTSVYQDLFNRQPDAGGLQTWTTSLEGGVPRIAVANAITYSPEYRSGLIGNSYNTYLNRTPESSGLQSWLGAMNAGLTIEQMEAGFIASPEYFMRAGGTASGWVTQLYQDVLKRAASPQEIASWVDSINRGASSAQVAFGFLLSSEHLGTVVDGYYQHLLARGIDPSGLGTWVGAIQGGARDEAIIGGIIASAEYLTHNSIVAVAPVSVLPGDIKPGASNTGVSFATVLTRHDGDVTITTPGTVIDGWDLHGFLTIKAANVTVKNSIVRGGATAPYSTGLINCTSSTIVNALIQDVTLVPDTPNHNVDGILGHDFTARRVNVYNTVDGFGVFNTNGPAANVTIESSYVHELAFFSPDSNHPDNKTHNDAIQIQGGSNITIVGNFLSAWLSGTAGTQNYPNPRAGFGVILTPNVNAVSSSRILRNWVSGSYIPIKLTTTPIGAMNFGAVDGNRFARDMVNTAIAGVSNYFTVLMTPDMTAETVGNVYEDNGAPVTVRRDSGTSTAP